MKVSLIYKTILDFYPNYPFIDTYIIYIYLLLKLVVSLLISSV